MAEKLLFRFRFSVTDPQLPLNWLAVEAQQNWEIGQVVISACLHLDRWPLGTSAVGETHFVPLHSQEEKTPKEGILLSSSSFCCCCFGLLATHKQQA